MAKGISLHIGVSNLDSNHYGNWDSSLNSTQNDIDKMSRLLSSKKFSINTLLNPKKSEFENKIKEISNSLGSGDIFCLTFSGHGGKIPDLQNIEPFNTTWCLYDAQLIDNELHNLLADYFTQGMRIIIISDSCHSGTMIRFTNSNKIKSMPKEVFEEVYIKNKSYYDNILNQKIKKISANVLHFSACGDNEETNDGTTTSNSYFTDKFLRKCSTNNSNLTYNQLYSNLIESTKGIQKPLLTFENSNFQNQIIFSI